MHRLPRFQISDDLHISIGDSMVQITPARGLQIAETLARKSFRRALAEEAETVAPKPAKKRPDIRAARCHVQQDTPVRVLHGLRPIR